MEGFFEMGALMQSLIKLQHYTKSVHPQRSDPSTGQNTC